MYKQESSPYYLTQRTPSFSSSLLDAICRSMDESQEINAMEFELGGEVTSQYKEATMYQAQSKQRNKRSSVSTSMKVGAFLEEKKQSSKLQREFVIEDWMEWQSTNRSCRISSASDPGSRLRISHKLFSSSQRMSSSNQAVKIAKPETQTKPNYGEMGFTKRTKHRALRMYTQFKKLKQPISPGGRISSLINSIFSSGSGKKVNLCSLSAMDDVRIDRIVKPANSSVPLKSPSMPPPKAKSTSTSTSISSMSSGSSRSGSSRSSSTKRSVRFYPITVIIGEDSRPCDHKSIYEHEDPSMTPRLSRKSKHDSKCSDYQVKKFDNLKVFDGTEEDSDYDDSDDNASWSSSDLFELDHLVGMGRYRKELPVYETTNIKMNKAIANGYIW